MDIIKEEMERGPFDIVSVIGNFQKIRECYDESGQIPFGCFISILQQFCVLFRQLGRLLGVAFSDVQEKIGVFRENNIKFPGLKGFFSFVEMEMQRGIHIYNGDNNSRHKAAQEYKEYNSTARNLLRMMWFLTFIKVTFQNCREYPQLSLSDVLSRAYETAFADKHGFFVRQGAKLAILAAGSREELIQAVSLKDPIPLMDQLLFNLNPVHQVLWKYYTQHNLVDLE